MKPLLAFFLPVLAGCASTSGEPEADSPPESPGASAHLFRILVPVSDLEQAVGFYSQILESPGIPVSDGRHYFDCGGTILACYDPRGDGDGYDAEPLPEWIYLAVDDANVAYERCRAAGAAFERFDINGTPSDEVARRPWGEVSFYVRDPFGNRLCFVERETMFTGRY